MCLGSRGDDGECSGEPAVDPRSSTLELSIGSTEFGRLETYRSYYESRTKCEHCGWVAGPTSLTRAISWRRVFLSLSKGTQRYATSLTSATTTMSKEGRRLVVSRSFVVRSRVVQVRERERGQSNPSRIFQMCPFRKKSERERGRLKGARSMCGTPERAAACIHHSFRNGKRYFLHTRDPRPSLSSLPSWGKKLGGACLSGAFARDDIAFFFVCVAITQIARARKGLEKKTRGQKRARAGTWRPRFCAATTSEPPPSRLFLHTESLEKQSIAGGERERERERECARARTRNCGDSLKSPSRGRHFTHYFPDTAWPWIGGRWAPCSTSSSPDTPPGTPRTSPSYF